MRKLIVLLIVVLMAGMAKQAVAQEKRETDTVHRFFMPGGAKGIGYLFSNSRHTTLGLDWLCIQSASPAVFSPVEALLEDTLSGDFHVTQLKVRGKITIALVGLDSCLIPQGGKVKPGTKLGNVKLQPGDKAFTLYCLIRKDMALLNSTETESLLRSLQ